MRMTVYGNNATCPEADGACSCFLIEFSTNVQNCVEKRTYGLKQTRVLHIE